MRESGHRQVEHTADLALELWAPSHEQLLVEGARAVIELVTGGAAVIDAEERAVDLEVVDAPDRLVRWLNEVLWLAMVEGFVFASATFDLDDPRRLRARVRGSVDTPVVAEVKSATYHDLAIEADGPRLRARVVLDV